MIITKLIGGLGNQMFQYALGRALSMKKNTLLKLDITGLLNGEGCTPREYALGIYDINATIATQKEIDTIKKFKLRHWLEKFLPYYRRSVNRTEQYHHIFDPNILVCKSNVYLEGYWQTEKYFITIADIIRQAFTNQLPQTNANRSINNLINSHDAVGIHIRRGDYVHNALARQFHNICQPEYYARAIALITSKITTPYFFIFSDDIPWAKANLKIKHHVEFIEGNLEYPQEDLRLLSCCKHFIIANSSFSWWAAWLATNPHKIVIAPKRWLADELIGTNDLLPDDWIKI